MQRLSRIFAILILAFLPAHPAPAKVVYVAQDATGDGSGSSWENACTNITAGLAASASGDEIWVKSATYSEAITLAEGVALYGGFRGDETTREARDWKANETIINAAGQNTHAVVAVDGAILDGLTITGGLAENGGGIYCVSASLTLANCLITGNRAETPGYLGGVGGALYCLDGSLTLTQCSVTDNVAEYMSGLYLKHSRLEMTGCLISENKMYDPQSVVKGGGGLNCSDSPAVMTDCTIIGNESGGIAGAGFAGDSTAVLTRCTVASNIGSGGGLAFGSCPATLIDCVIMDNVGKYCGGAEFAVSRDVVIEPLCDRAGAEGLDCQSMYPTTLINCLVTGNRATEHGTPYSAAGLVFSNVVPVLKNCTIADNRYGGIMVWMDFYYVAGGGYCGCNSLPVLENCINWDWIIVRWLKDSLSTIPISEGVIVRGSCLKERDAGPGYINDDPLFVNPAGGDYRLRADSPCIDSGSNALALEVPLDLDGKARIADGDSDGVSTVDMGAYEFQPLAPPDPHLWILDGLGQVHQLPAPTPTS